MTQKQALLRKQLIIKIHTHPKYKELKNNEAWEDWLYVRYKEKSSGLLSISELEEILHIFSGRRNDRDFALIDPNREIIIKKGRLSFAQLQKIRIIKEELSWNDKDLEGFMTRMLKKSKALRELSIKEASKVIIGLEKTLKYKKSKGSGLNIFKVANNTEYKG
ncbi:phage protein GemA/Gp16 family protein [Helicobacter sp. 13S00477-4]|uniref:phage protein GemA/Gp16 family protein n=1 Tax=Helicobacter sp. 13S00477-4 TaxID=1905759 RepID=UPI000BA6746A|nr:phage protein GemA/Gp16 family protein [Helicobacter sp. 13S00477-4]PAF51300.1 hypothetical protein BKH44_06235 [Helicobacter sp. 13S00477-4]